jgi:hypothetical protein
MAENDNEHAAAQAAVFKDGSGSGGSEIFSVRIGLLG